MILKLIFFLSLITFWLGLVGIPTDLYSIILLCLVPFMSFWFTNTLGLFPQKNYLRYNSIRYCFWLMKEIITSSISVCKIAWSRNLHIQPIVSPVKSIQKQESAIIIYANSITLTPGTVTLSMEGNVLLVHAIDVKFMDDLQEGDMDKKIQEIIKE